MMVGGEFTDAPPPLPGLGLPDLDDGQLLALAETLDNVHVRWCVRVLAHNRTTPAIREACRRDLREALALGKFDGHCHPDTVDVIDDGSTVEVKCGTCHTVLVEVPR